MSTRNLRLLPQSVMYRRPVGVQCILSTRPLVAGWKAVVWDRWMPHILVREWKSCDSNCRPWSVVMVCGHQ